jgi:4-hydroxybenzoate polyprenyltransferase
MTQASQARGVLALIRAVDGGSAAAMVVLGALLAGADSWFRVVATATAAFAAMSFAMAMNDRTDQIGDRANGRLRPLVLGSVSERVALQIAGVAAVLALVAGGVAGLGALAFVAVYLLLGWLYSRSIKVRAPLGAPTVVAVLAASTVMLGGIVGNSVGPTLLAAATAGVFMLGRELLKAARDESGDRVQGCRTFAIAFGPGRAVQGYAALSIGAGVLAAVPLIVDTSGAWAVLAFLNLGYLVVLATYILCKPTAPHIARIVNLSKASWVLWIATAIALAAGRVG